MKRRLRPGPDHPVRTGRPSPVRQPEEQEREKGEAGKNDSWQTPDADYRKVKSDFASSGKLHLHATVLVRIDFLALGAGDMGRLLVENQVFGMFRGRDKTGHLRNGRDPRGIVQAAPVRGLVLQHAGLPAFYEMFYRNAYAPCGARYGRLQVVPDLSRTGANRLESKQKAN